MASWKCCFFSPGFCGVRFSVGACPLSCPGLGFCFGGAWFFWDGVAHPWASASLLLLPFPGELLWLVEVLGCLVAPAVGVCPLPSSVVGSSVFPSPSLCPLFTQVPRLRYICQLILRSCIVPYIFCDIHVCWTCALALLLFWSKLHVYPQTLATTY